LPHRDVVLIADDDPAMLRSVARLLRQFGYASLLFPSADAFRNHRDFENVACIVLDIDLGDGSGIELKHHLNEANISVPVIYMTGNDSPPFARLRFNQGVSRISQSRSRRSR
jgi:FixJ family two-component response regulator